MDIAGYTVTEPLGRNAFSTVYLAKHPKVKGRYVIRHLSQQAADDAEIAATFLQGANQATEIIHPNLVRVYQYGQHMERPFCIMEYVAGDSLAKKRASMCLLDKMYVVKQAAKTLAYLAKFNLAHLNVNPANIYLKKGDTSIVLAGFGFAPSLGPLATDADQSYVEAAHFMSPEQVNDSKVGLKSDIYSLGAVFYWLLTGKYLQRANSVDALREALDKQNNPVISLSASKKIFADVLSRMLQYEPSARFRSMTQVLEALEGFSDEAILAADVEEGEEEALAALPASAGLGVDVIGAGVNAEASGAGSLHDQATVDAAVSSSDTSQLRRQGAKVVALAPRQPGKDKQKHHANSYELSDLLEKHPEIFAGGKNTEEAVADDNINPFTVVDRRDLSATPADPALERAVAAQLPDVTAKEAPRSSENNISAAAKNKATFTARTPHQPPRAANPRYGTSGTKRRKNHRTAETQVRAARVASGQLAKSQAIRSSTRSVLLQALLVFILLAPLALGTALLLAPTALQQQIFDDYIAPARAFLIDLKD